MTRINTATNTENIPQIVLYNRKPQQMVCLAANEEQDSFKKEKKGIPTPILLDPNDKFILNNDDSSEPKILMNDNMLGASVNSKKMKDMFKWGKRIWTGLEIYDTIDGYRDRFSDKNNTEQDV